MKSPRTTAIALIIASGAWSIGIYFLLESWLVSLSCNCQDPSSLTTRKLLFDFIPHSKFVLLCINLSVCRLGQKFPMQIDSQLKNVCHWSEHNKKYLVSDIFNALCIRSHTEILMKKRINLLTPAGNFYFLIRIQPALSASCYSCKWTSFFQD